jgi:hypothetical protein
MEETDYEALQRIRGYGVKMYGDPDSSESDSDDDVECQFGELPELCDADSDEEEENDEGTCVA